MISALLAGDGRAHLNRENLQAGITDSPSFLRYVIIEVICDPTVIDETTVDYYRHTLGVANWEFARTLPRNTVIVQRVLNEGGTASEPPQFAFPFFPSHLSLPCKVGEQVWVFFESSKKRQNIPFWLCRVNDPGYADDVNHTHQPRNWDPSFEQSTQKQFDGTAEPVYDFQPGAVNTAPDGTRYSQPETATLADPDPFVYERILRSTNGAALTNYEAVPRYKKRPPDLAFEGSNNTLFVLGTERSGVVAEYTLDPTTGLMSRLPERESRGSAGEILLVTGRGQTEATGGKVVQNSLGRNEIGKSRADMKTTEGDPDIINDRSTFLMSSSTDIDSRLGLSDFNVNEIGLEKTDDGHSVIVLKSDRMRFVVRKDIEFIAIGSIGSEKLQDGTDMSQFSAIVLKADGNLVLKPSATGYVLLGGEDADKAIMTTDVGVSSVDGKVSAPPVITTMGGLVGGTGFSGQGVWATKVKVK